MALDDDNSIITMSEHMGVIIFLVFMSFIFVFISYKAVKYFMRKYDKNLAKVFKYESIDALCEQMIIEEKQMSERLAIANKNMEELNNNQRIYKKLKGQYEKYNEEIEELMQNKKKLELVKQCINMIIEEI